MLQGKSKIQLFNAKTGVLEAETENHNIITNAVSDILNRNDSMGLLRTASGLVQEVDYAAPFATNAFGGILLWGDNITEDPTITMPPTGTTPIGHAGSAYSGNNSCRGTYNGNESGVLDNGYRLVWDFGTDKANGTINCLTLTSKHGGDCGWNNDAGFDATDVKPPYGVYSFNNATAEPSTSVCANYNYNYNHYTFASSDIIGRIFYTYKDSGGNIVGIFQNGNYLYTTTFPSPLKWGISTVKTHSEIKQLCELNITGAYQTSAEYSTIYFYNNAIHQLYVKTDRTTICHNTYSITGELLTQNEIVVESFVPYSRANSIYFYENRYYIYSETVTVNSQRYYRFFIYSNAGVFVQNLDIATIYDYSEFSLKPFVNSYGDLEIYLATAARENVYYFCIPKNAPTTYYKHSQHYAMPSGYDSSYRMNCLTYNAISPWRYFATIYNSSTYGVRLLTAVDYRYLATINNLAEPVTKTNAQTMKITYDLVET